MTSTTTKNTEIEPNQTFFLIFVPSLRTRERETFAVWSCWSSKFSAGPTRNTYFHPYILYTIFRVYCCRLRPLQSARRIRFVAVSVTHHWSPLSAYYCPVCFALQWRKIAVTVCWLPAVVRTSHFISGRCFGRHCTRQQHDENFLSVGIDLFILQQKAPGPSLSSFSIQHLDRLLFRPFIIFVVLNVQRTKAARFALIDFVT